MLRSWFARSAAAAVTASLIGALGILPVGVGAAAPRLASEPPPSPGAPGVGDRLYPTLGNAGYDALHYDLDLRYAMSAPTQGIDGTVTMTARATASLSRFDLDFGGDRVGEVTVDGIPAEFSRSGDELVITPFRPVRAGLTFVVQVRHFTAEPKTVDPDSFLSTAFFVTPDGSATAGQPDNMHDVFPCNDHPGDKASFSFRLDVPRGQTAVANGVRTGRHVRHGRAVWTYEQRQPMATELTQIAVGTYAVIHRRSVHGTKVRDVVPTRLLGQYRDLLAVERRHLAWMERRVGRYPFPDYGSLVVDTHLGFALETQTLSLYDTPWFSNYPRGLWDPVMLHELAHQWFGDSVAPAVWSDVWLNEGHATWYEQTYAAGHGFLKDDTGFADFTELMKAVYAVGDQWRSEYGPVARPRTAQPAEALFNINVYYGGSLALYALRQKIGTKAFGQVERAWVRQYRGTSASTEDFIRLASRVSHRNLDGFLHAWLYGTRTPPMPGHPDWTVAPVQASPASLDAQRDRVTPRFLLRRR